MSNDYFNATTTIARFSRGASAVVNGIFESIASGFDLLPGRDALNQDRVTYLTGGGTANAITAGMTPALTSYEPGLNVKILLAATNTGAATLNIDGLGARSVVRPDGPALAGDLTAGDVADLIYNGTSFIIMGVPRAAAGVIEQGSNANGRYVRFADGTQICWRNDFTISAAASNFCGATWTFPAAFSGIPAVNLQLAGGLASWTAPDVRGDISTVVGTPSGGTTANMGFFTASFANVTVTVSNNNVIAIGRWF